MIQGVIFDMDGLMFNTEIMFLEMFPKIAKKRGLDIPRDVCMQMIGTDSSTAKRFEQEYPGFIESMQEFQATRIECYKEMYPNKGDGDMPGLKELITYLNESKTPYAIASSSAVEDIKTLISYADCDIQPQTIVSSKMEGIRSKPNPDIFIEAAKQLKIEPEHALVLEDSKNGVMATRRAKMKSIYIPDQVHQDRSMYPYVYRTCESLADVVDVLKEESV